jgi:hypothetical protein
MQCAVDQRAGVDGGEFISQIATEQKGIDGGWSEVHAKP